MPWFPTVDSVGSCVNLSAVASGDLKQKLWLIPYRFFVICLFFLSSAVCMIASCLAGCRDRDGGCSHRWLVRWATATLALAGLEIQLAGLERLDPRRTYLFMPNHASFLDILLVFAFIPYDFRIITKQEMFSIPFIGWSLKCARQIPLDRANPRKGLRSLRQAEEYLKKGTSVVVFPEGTRTCNGEIQEFKPTLFILPIRSGISVVPVLIEGTFEALKRGSLCLNPVPLKLTFFEPVSSASFKDQDRWLYARKVRDILTSALAPR